MNYEDQEARTLIHHMPADKVFAALNNNKESWLYSFVDAVSKSFGKFGSDLAAFKDDYNIDNCVTMLDDWERGLGVFENNPIKVYSTDEGRREIIKLWLNLPSYVTLPQWNYIAEVLKVTIGIERGSQRAVFPLRLPAPITSLSLAQLRFVMYVEINETLESKGQIFPIPFPVKLSAASKKDAMKYVLDTITPSYIKIIYTN
jgi:hypothetical protein